VVRDFGRLRREPCLNRLGVKGTASRVRFNGRSLNIGADAPTGTIIFYSDTKSGKRLVIQSRCPRRNTLYTAGNTHDGDQPLPGESRGRKSVELDTST
jgi:hypothetical protein